MAQLKGRVRIATNSCKGCGLCTIACPEKIIIIDDTAVNLKGYSPAAVTEPAKCHGCGNCAMMCPDSVLTVERFAGKRGVEHA